MEYPILFSVIFCEHLFDAKDNCKSCKHNTSAHLKLIQILTLSYL
jgi:hypothetical protein